MKIPQQAQPCQILFLDVTDTKSDPVLLGNGALLCSPALKERDKLTFQKVKEGEQFNISMKGDKPTHTVQKIHWGFSSVDDEEGFIMAHMIVNLRKIDQDARPVVRNRATKSYGQP